MKTLLTLLLLIPSLSWGADNRFYNYMATECGVIVNDWHDDYITRNYVWGALSGYVTSKNEVSGGMVGLNTEIESQLLEIFNYCEDNPLKQLYDAVVHSYNAIKNKEGY